MAERVDRSIYFAEVDSLPQEMLDPWRWLIGHEEFSVLSVTAMGSVFLRAVNGSVHFLDATTATFRRVAETTEAYASLFDSAENRRSLLWSHFVRLLRAKHPLAPGQCYSWRVPPVLGGEIDFDNVDATDVAVHVSIQGQLHQQARSQPEGF